MEEFCLAHLVDVGERENTEVTVDQRVDMGGKIMQIAMHRTVWGKSSLGVLTVKYPADWWQHFKQRWFPLWAQQRWPSLMTTEVFDAGVYAPELILEKQDGTRYATFTILSPSPEEWE